jgi:predicted nuclease of predicted toxin-antitoxin system
MKFYLDDDIASPLLAQTLRRAGYDVRTPADAGLPGASDSVHFRRAINEGRTILTRNYDDFEDLHYLVIDAGGNHPGVLAVRRDDPKRRNMKPHEIVRALHKLETAETQIADVYEELNHWR